MLLKPAILVPSGRTQQFGAKFGSYALVRDPIIPAKPIPGRHINNQAIA